MLFIDFNKIDNLGIKINKLEINNVYNYKLIIIRR